MARAFSYNRTGRNPAASNATPSGLPQGTIGGPAMASSGKPGRMTLRIGDEMYLWILLFIEVGGIGFLRSRFRRYHGG